MSSIKYKIISSIKYKRNSSIREKSDSRPEKVGRSIRTATMTDAYASPHLTFCLTCISVCHLTFELLALVVSLFPSWLSILRGNSHGNLPLALSQPQLLLFYTLT